ncbi:unnamed protein product [Sphagnum jensenii]|uniref:Complex 1 LYR protein domain-containing protein n=1 Tax=Sphagnum jensenii TaxID=128206 RepID=A0ABP0WGJ4_9BRYO
MWRWWWRGVVLRREVHNGPDALEELVERHVGQGKPQHASAGLTTHRQVVLRRGVHNGPDTLEELVERHVRQGKPHHVSAGLTTHRQIVLRRGVHSGPDTLEELVERHVARGKPQHASTGLTTHRREALSLYREILRASQLFIWTNEQGVPWRDLLCESARHEFEQARNEKDPEVIARLLVVGRDAVHRTLEKFASKRDEVLKERPQLGGEPTRPGRWN